MFKNVIYNNVNELKQASVLNRSYIDLKHSEFFRAILIWLLKRGYIHSFIKIYKQTDKTGRKAFIVIPYLRVFLKYLNTGRGVLNEIEPLSKPTKILSLQLKNISRKQNGMVLMSTSYGLITANEAAALNVGGTALFIIRI